MVRRVLFIACLILLSPIVGAAKLESLSIQKEEGTTSVMCIITGELNYKTFSLSNPERVVVDFIHTSSNVNTNKARLTNDLITHVRSGYPNSKALRLVFDVNQPVHIKTTTWMLGNKRKQGLRIDLETKVATHPAADQPLIVKSMSKAPVRVQRAPQSLRDVIVVLDPGHGGKDPGAIGSRRIAEKNVVLAIAFKLKQLIDKQPGMHAVLTRNGDYYVGLRQRLDIARRYNADIFISIHADAFINHHSNGASVFALSQRGATSEAARWLAEKENYSELGGVNLSSLDDENGVLRTVLLDLSQTATIHSSLQMGSRILHHIDRITNLHNSKVEQARFVVLKSPDIPSVLIETGFITNPQEERHLTSPIYQTQLTQAIFAGVKQYFWDYPPHGTRLEAMSGASLHIVHRGESLPAIAAHYHVSVAALKNTNHLIDDELEIGQRLSIPSLG